MTIDDVVRHFRAFLEASLPVITQLPGMEESHDLKADWLQANWEMLVETAAREKSHDFLEIYGDGADCNDASSRVWSPNAMPTHRISCRPVGVSFTNVLSKDSLTENSLPFDRFVSWDGSQYDDSVPFNFVMLDHKGTPVIVGLNEVVFFREQI